MNKLRILTLVLLVPFIVNAQKKIDVVTLYDGTFGQESVYNINWMNDGQYYSAQEGNDIVKYDVTKGTVIETILKGEDLSPTIKFSNYSFSADEKKVLLMTDRKSIYRRSYTASFYVYDFTTKKLKKLSEGGRQAYATFSPDGSKVGFTRDNNLFYVDLVSGKETQITSDGKFNHIINGSADWVYEEELYLTKAFDWSGDSKKIAYISFDESKVREYNMQKWNHGELYPEDYRFKYPKAGEDNSSVKLTIFHIDKAKNISVDLGDNTDFYIARINWTKDTNVLSYRILNRLQNQLDYYHADATSGNSKLVLSDKSDTYVDLTYIDDLIYLNDGKTFITSSEKDGYKHLYQYTIDGKLVKQITQGEWGVESFAGIDQKSKKLYYISTEISPLERHFYSIGLDGKSKTKLSKTAGNNSVNMSNDFKYYINYVSNSTTPLNVSLFKTKGNSLVKVLKDNKKAAEVAKEYNLQPKQFFTTKAADGQALNGYMLKPADFDATKKYPLMMFQYSGPGSQQVKNSWGASNFTWHQMLVQKGYIIVVVDGRGTGGRGTAFKNMTYKQLGKLEVEDQITVAKEMGSRSYIDETRIGIWGWSYGGYMSSMCMMKGAEVFKAGIAVAPVTNWRYYDTIYTERYQGLPQDNASGYDDNSPSSHADKMRGNFLLVHGTGDDNVHFQNSVALQQALIDAGKQFDSFYYPDNAHGIYRGGVRPHLFTMMTNWVLENL
ncbi:MAG: S9 family peptidase [Cyclobacteriaceae bacterium]|nr:S9 family peptidase [Cyclobacteriaceae bacterium]